MKKLVLVCVILAMILLPAFLVSAGCESAGAAYYSTFSLNGGDEITCSLGYTDIDSDGPFAAVQSGTWTFFSGSSVSKAFEEPASGDHICVDGMVYGVVAKEYLYSNFDFNITIYITQDGVDYIYIADGGSITITSFGAAGEAVEGTFTLHVYNALANGLSMTPQQLEDAYDVEGSFRVQRIEYPLPIEE